MLSAKNMSPRNSRSLSKREQLQKSIFGTDENESAATGTDYASMFSTASRSPSNSTSENNLIDIRLLKPAPMEWNFYTPLSDYKMYEMIESIANIGLQHPIIIWETKEEDGYIILSGHNRVRAFEMIYNATNMDEYQKIPAIIYKHDDITEEKAREIIVDINWVQRSLKPVEMARSVAAKIVFVNSRRKTEKMTGRTRDIVAKEYGLEGRQVENYKRIAELDPCFINLLDENKLTITSGSIIAGFDIKTQQWMYEKFFKDKEKPVKTTTISKLNSKMNKKEIEEVFNSEIKENERTKINIEVPYGLEKSFNELFEEWVNRNNLTSKDFKIYIK